MWNHLREEDNGLGVTSEGENFYESDFVPCLFWVHCLHVCTEPYTVSSNEQQPFSFPVFILELRGCYGNY